VKRIADCQTAEDDIASAVFYLTARAGGAEQEIIIESAGLPVISSNFCEENDL